MAENTPSPTPHSPPRRPHRQAEYGPINQFTLNPAARRFNSVTARETWTDDMYTQALVLAERIDATALEAFEQPDIIRRARDHNLNTDTPVGINSPHERKRAYEIHIFRYAQLSDDCISDAAKNAHEITTANESENRKVAAAHLSICKNKTLGYITQTMKKLVYVTGGVEVWRAANRDQRRAVILDVLEGSPIAFSKYAFPNEYKAVAFETIWLTDRENMKQYRAIVKWKWYRLCKSALEHMILPRVPEKNKYWEAYRTHMRGPNIERLEATGMLGDAGDVPCRAFQQASAGRNGRADDAEGRDEDMEE